MRISSRTAQAKTYKYCFNGYVIEILKLFSHSIQSTQRIQRNKNPKSVLCDDNAKKYQVSSSIFLFYIDYYRPLESSLPLFSILFEFFCVMKIDYCFTFDRNSLVETL